ncbi:hypothetical protein D3C72_2417600 [compost metagenome]
MEPDSILRFVLDRSSPDDAVGGIKCQSFRQRAAEKGEVLCAGRANRRERDLIVVPDHHVERAEGC